MAAVASTKTKMGRTAPLVPPTIYAPSLTEQVMTAVDEWAQSLRVICAPALARLSGIPETSVVLGLDELATQRHIKRVGPGIFVVQPLLN